MRQSRYILLAALFGLVSSTGSRAVTADDGFPYQPIIDRNVFSLKPPQKEVIEQPPPPPPVPPHRVELTGITTILDRKLALMMVSDTAAPSVPPLSFILTEGQREGQIEVLKIDEKSSVVTIKNGPYPQTVQFQKKAAGGAPAGPASPNPNVPAPPPAGMSSAAAAALNAAGSPAKQIPFRTMRLPATPDGSAQPQANAQPPPMPSMPGVVPPSPAAPQAPPLNLEEQTILMELEHELNKNNPLYPPMPPTPMNPTRNLAPPGPPGLPPPAPQ